MANLLSPKTTLAGPGPRKRGVRRLNNRPMLILFSVTAMFGVLVATEAYKRSHRQEQARVEEQKSGAFVSLPKDDRYASAGIIEAKAAAPAPAPAASAASGPAVTVARPDADLDLPPVPPGGRHQASGHDAPGGQGSAAPPQDETANRIRQLKEQQFMAAVTGKTAVQVDLLQRGSGAGTSGGGMDGAPAGREQMLARMAELQQQAANAGSSQDATAAYQARAAQAGGGAGLPAAGVAPTRTGMAQFAGQPGVNRWALDAQVQAPASPYMLLAGGSIPAILDDEINSELPGQTRATVSRNVYDTATGQHLLIPQGSQLLGAYSSDGNYGQKSILVAWQRINFPDGKWLDLGAMPGADAQGRAGLRDQVNNHYLRTFGAAFLMSGIVAGITYSQRQGQSVYGAPTAGSVLSEAVGQQLGQVAAQMIAKNLNLAPERDIRRGYRFIVTVTKDVTFPKAYEAFDYQRSQR